MTATQTARLRAPDETDAAAVASWSRSVEEARRWCSVAVHPFPADVVTGWWQTPDVVPRVLVGTEDEHPVAYGELWTDEEEDEVELARIIVDPDRRRAGIGRQLITHLVEAARATGLSDCYLRVVPDNVAALALYRSTGFVDVDEERTRAWNEGQPTEFCWLERPDFPSAGGSG